MNTRKALVGPRKEIAQLSTLFKYVSDKPEVVDGVFRDHKIRFTQPAVLNDPLEFNPAIRFDSEGNHFKRYECNGITMPSMHDWERINLIERRINEFGVLSLTDNPFSFEMWCHYASGHRGLIIEFKIPDKSKPTLQLLDGANLKAHKVKYAKDYVINMDRLYGERGRIPFHKIKDAVFLRKTKHWEYEREYRVVRQLSECSAYQPPVTRTSYRDQNVYLFPLSLSCISSVIFGIYTPRETKEKVIEYCKNTDIKFLQTIVYKDLRNKIDYLPVEGFGPIGAYLEKLPQIFLYDSIELKYSRDHITVDSLHELPYYHLQPDDWDEYHRKQLNKKDTIMHGEG
jgi:hypothetical protein